MSVLDDIRQAVADSQKLDAGAKSVVTAFLQAAGPALETLAPAVVRDLLSDFAAGDGASAAAGVADAFSADEVATTLGALEPQMESEVSQRGGQVAASEATMAAAQKCGDFGGGKAADLRPLKRTQAGVATRLAHLGYSRNIRKKVRFCLAAPKRVLAMGTLAELFPQ